MIQRDGFCISLWQESVEDYKVTSKIDPSQIYDVAIVGGGITGITTALKLQKEGMKCVVMEAETLCFGTTGGTTAHLNTLLDTSYATISKNFGKESAALIARETAKAISLVKKNIDEFQIDCEFQDAEAYLFARNNEQSEQLGEIMEASVEAGLNMVKVSDIPVSIPFVNAVKVGGQGKFHPTRYVHALARAFENAGGVIVQKCRVLGINENELADLTTTRGKYRAGRVIYATHIPPGVNLIHLRAIPYRSYAMAVHLKSENYLDSLCYDLDDPYHYYRSQEIDGKKFLIAGGYDHKTAHESNTEKCFLELESHIRTFFPVKEISFRWSSQYFEPADGLPYIGRLPGHTDLVYVASGLGGNGITYSHVAASVLKSILLNEKDPAIDLFNPNRIKPVAGFKNFITHNADVIKQFASKLLPHEKLEELADLAPDEGRVIVFEGKKIAIYKDEDGKFHALNPACTHLKCTVSWNLAERSWDCPCHGTRFNSEGEILTGPATQQLEKVSVENLVVKKDR
jgi:glycine/D-amino acid oxidase-like deaminating enzyme/nitrite reductase/ring-hydroxylating ferredoxin subunit